MTSLLVKEAQAATLLAISPRSLRKLRGDGQIDYVLIGAAIRYSIADLDRFIAARKTRCACSKGPEARSGGTISPSNVIAFESLRES